MVELLQGACSVCINERLPQNSASIERNPLHFVRHILEIIFSNFQSAFGLRMFARGQLELPMI